MPPVHGTGEQVAAQRPGVCGGHGLGEEKPDVGPIPRPGALHGGSEAQPGAGFPKGGHILPPGVLVKIRRQQPGAVAFQHGVQPRHVPAREVGFHHPRRQGEERPAGAVRAAVGFFVAQPRLPLVFTGGDIAAFSRFQAAVAFDIDIFPPAEQGQGQEQANLFLGGVCGADAGRRAGWGACCRQSSSGQTKCAPFSSEHSTKSPPPREGSGSIRRYLRFSKTMYVASWFGEPCIFPASAP